MAAGDLTTLADVKLWLGLTAVTDDTQLHNLISRASSFIQEYLARDIVQTTYTNEIYHGCGNDALVVRNYPIISLTSLMMDGSAFDLVNNAVFDDRTIYCQNGFLFNRGRANLRLTYVAGFAVVPGIVAQAAIELVTLRYRERDRIGHSSKQIQGGTVSFIVKDFHPATKSALDQIKNKVPA